jgi:tetratricopeptide (TPR) repeat protein
MAVPTTHPVSRLIALAGVLVVSAALVFFGCRRAIAESWAGSQDPQKWLRAAQWEPANAENWYRLGRYRQLDFENSDLPQAISYYQRATAVDPLPARYWLDLAEAYETAGEDAQADFAFRKAQLDYPISADVAWRRANFLLRQGRAQEAFQEIHQAVSTDPKLALPALALCWRSTQDIDLILRSALPSNSTVDWAAIRFFTEPPQPDAALAVWKRLMMDNASFPISSVFPLEDLLIEAKRANDAQTVWRQAVSVAGISRPPGPADSLIWDGGFERPLLNGGLAWRYLPVPGAQLDLDQETIHSGSRALRVSFDGTQNVDFANLWQFVVVEPNTRYSFSAYLRTQDLTTESAVRFEIVDANQNANLHTVTPGATGTQPWTRDAVGFATGPTTRLLRISLRRMPSTMLANKVRGTAWVDDVQLIAAPELGRADK